MNFTNLIALDLAKFCDLPEYNPKIWFSLLNPRFLPVLFYRLSSLFYHLKLKVLSRIFSFVNFVLFGCDFGMASEIGGGLFLPHSNGIVVGNMVRIGKNCILHQGVTLGAKRDLTGEKNPRIGDNVEIGTGSKILGGIEIGDYSLIGANCVMTRSVPPKSIVVGIPGKVIKTRTDI